MPLTPKIVAPGEGALQPAPGGGFSHVKLAAADTENALSLAEFNVGPGAGPPLHMHTREDETFWILEGAVTFHVGGRRIEAAAGTAVFAPRGVPHTFKNCSTRPARMLLIVTPPANFEGFYSAVTAPTASGGPPDEATIGARIGAEAPRFGLTMLGPSPL